ncbi:hypothetical protein ACFX2F_002097 [Malus domestica]
MRVHASHLDTFGCLENSKYMYNTRFSHYYFSIKLRNCLCLIRCHREISYVFNARDEYNVLVLLVRECNQNSVIWKRIDRIVRFARPV